MKRFKKSGLTDGASSEWSESEHPRDEGGKFSEKGDADGFEKSDNLSAAANSEGLTSEPNSGTIQFKELNTKEFHGVITAAKESNIESKKWRVDVHKICDYSEDKLFVTDGGSCVAVEESGNIVSLCKNRNGGERSVARALLEKAIAEGGDRLDAFGEDLYEIYTRNGFEPVSWTPFNDKYAPKGWKPEYGREAVVFYKYTGKQVKETFTEFKARVSPQVGDDGYDQAAAIRDEEIGK